MLLASLFACVGVMKAQPAEEQLYRIKNVATNYYLDITSAQTGGIKIKTLDESSLNQCFYFIPKDVENNMYYIKSANNQYVARVGSSLWDMCATNDVPSGNSGDITLVSVEGVEGQYYLQTTSTASWGNNVAPNDDSNGAEGSSVYSDKAQTAKYVKWIFEEVQLSLVDLVVNYTYNGNNVGTTTLRAAPDAECVIPALDYTNVKSCKIGDAEATEGATIVVPATAATVTVELEANLPFTVSTDYENATWYAVQIRGNKYVVRSEAAPYSNTTATPTTEDALWAFVGDPFNGIQVLNKAAGAGYTLGYDEIATANNIYMKEGTTTWTIQKGNGGFVLCQDASKNEYIHDYGSKLQYWVAGGAKTDNGSAFVVTSEAEMISLATTAKNELNAKLDVYAEASYYTFSNDVVAAAKAALQAIATPTTLLAALQAKAAVEAAQASLTDQGTTAPAVGDIIMLKNRQYSKYLKANDADLTSVVGRNDLATLWVVEEGDAEGKVKLKNYSTEKYISEIRQSATVAMVDAANAKQFAFTKQDDVYAVFKETTGGGYAYGHIAGHNVLVGWEASANASQWIVSNVRPLSITYLFNGEELSTSTEIVKSGTVYTIVSPDFTAITSCTVNNEPLEAIDGVYSFEATAASEVVVTLEEALPFEAAASANDITTWYHVRMHTNQPGYIGDIAEDKTINVYYGKSSDVASDNFVWGFVRTADDRFIVVNKGTDLQLTSTGEGNVTLTENGTAFALVGTSETSANAANGFCLRVGDSNNYLNANYSAGKLSHWTDTDAGSTFFLSEYVETEVTVSSVDWATMYLGYAAYIPEGVNVYAVTGVENGYVTKSLLEGVIPANTGVLLENAGAYTFKKAAKDPAAVADNLLDGSVENTYVEGTAYVLANGENGVGLYRAKLNKDAEGNEGDTHFLNNAGKAYLVLPAETGAAMFSLSRGGEDEESTGIDQLISNGEAVIYDLSGRRVEKMEKGIYIVNGKKVVK